MVVYEFTNYRTFLRGVLSERSSGNSRYSMRALAGQLGFAPSMLSAVFAGKANFSSTALRKVASRLHLDNRQAEYLCLLADLEASTDPFERENLMTRLHMISPNFPTHDLDVDQFRQISEWYHSAILELCRLPGARGTPGWIARRLGISTSEAEAAAERLVRLGFLKRLQTGRYVRVGKRVEVVAKGLNPGIAHFYRQMLGKIDHALGTQAPPERVSGFETFPLDPKALPEVRAALDRFQSELQYLSSKYTEHQHVYHAAIHVLRLTQPEKAP